MVRASGCLGIVLLVALTGCGARPKALSPLSSAQAEQAVVPEPEPPAEGKPTVGHEWTQLFDGTTLDGWKKPDESEFEPTGSVSVEDGTLRFESGTPYAALQWAGEFPRESFEVEVTAKRTEGSDIFCGLLVPVGASHISVILGGWGDTVVGVSCVDHLYASDNETSRVMSFENDKWYDVRVRVTKERVLAWIDESKVIDLERKGHVLTPYPGLEALAPFAIFTWETGASFRDVWARRVVTGEVLD